MHGGWMAGTGAGTRLCESFPWEVIFSLLRIGLPLSEGGTKFS